MKKFLFVIALMCFTLPTFAQTKFFRAIDLTIGLKNNGKIEWGETSSQSLLIKVDNSVMVIYSKEVQTFRVITYDGQYDNGVKRWYCSDDKGINCYLYIAPEDEKTKLMTIGIEYLDLAYYYRGRQE